MEGIDVVGGAGQGAALGTMITPGLGTAIGGALGAIGGIFSSSSSAKAQQQANEAAANNTFWTNWTNMQMQKEVNQQNLEEAQRNREFQEKMSSSAHQREVADLEAAGLNPILSSKYGGSSSPSGNMAVLQASHNVAPEVRPVQYNPVGGALLGALTGAREGLGSAREANQMEIEWKSTEQKLYNMHQGLLNMVKEGALLDLRKEYSASENVIKKVQEVFERNYGIEVRMEELNSLKERIKNIQADTRYTTDKQRQEAINAEIVEQPWYRNLVGKVVLSAPAINAGASAANAGSNFLNAIQPWKWR